MNSHIKRKRLKSGKWSYYPVIVINEREHYFGGFSSKEAARARLKRAELEYARGEERITFQELYDRWLKAKRAQWKPLTLISYENTFKNHILPFFGEYYIQDITPLLIQSWVQAQKNHDTGGAVSPATVKRHYRYLASCLNQAVKWDILSASPCRGIILPQDHAEEVAFLEPQEVMVLISHLKEPYCGLVGLLAWSGLRYGEAVGLRWEDIDFDRGLIKVQRTYHPQAGYHKPKSGKARPVPLLPILSEYLYPIRRSSGLLFPSANDTPITSWTLRRHLKRAFKAAGLNYVTIHSLRHTFASAWLASNGSIKALQIALGHSTITLTLNRYGHLLKEDPGDTPEKVSELFKSDGQVIDFHSRDIPLTGSDNLKQG